MVWQLKRQLLCLQSRELHNFFPFHDGGGNFRVQESSKNHLSIAKQWAFYETTKNALSGFLSLIQQACLILVQWPSTRHANLFLCILTSWQARVWKLTLEKTFSDYMACCFPRLILYLFSSYYDSVACDSTLY